MKQLINKIIVLEKKHNLFDFQFKNYSVWSSYRMYFYYFVATDLKILEKPVAGFKKDLNYIKKIINIFNFRKLFEKKDIFVLEHSRSNREKIDIYTYDIVNYYGEDKCGFFAFSNNGIVEKKDRVIILDLIKIISKIISKFSQGLIVTDKNFKNFINAFDGIERNKYITQYKRYTLELKLQYYFYYFLLKIKKIKKVILVVSYYNMPLIFAAKSLNIEVIEMQHGVVSKYHLGYHYPYYKTNFFPDKLLTFSRFWNGSADYPECKIINVGNSFLYAKKQKIQKLKNTILIISQATIGKKLEEFMVSNLDKLNQYKIFFKLHPNEFNNYKKNYQKLLKYENVNIVSNEYSIHQLQNFCEYQIGIYSTAVYEGIERRCRTLLLNEVGIEYMEQVIKNDYAILINYDDNIIEKLMEVKEPKNVTFFDKFFIKGKI